MEKAKKSTPLEDLDKKLHKEHDRKQQLSYAIQILQQTNKSNPSHFSANFKKLVLRVLGFSSSSDTSIWKEVKNSVTDMVAILDQEQLLYLLTELGSIANSNRYKGSILLKCFISSVLENNSNHLEVIVNHENFYKIYFNKINYTRKLKIKSYKNNKKFDSISLYSYIEPVLKILHIIQNTDLQLKVLKFIIKVLLEENCNTVNAYNNGVTSNLLSNRKKKIKRIKLAYSNEDLEKKNRKRLKCLQNFTKNIVSTFKLTEGAEMFNFIKGILFRITNIAEDRAKSVDIPTANINRQVEPILELFLLQLIHKSFQYTERTTELKTNHLKFVNNETKQNYLKLLLLTFNKTKSNQMDIDIRLFYLNLIFGLIKNKVINEKKYQYTFSLNVLNSILKNSMVSLAEIPLKLKIIVYSLKQKILTSKDLRNKLKSICNFCIEYLEQQDTELGVLDLIYVIFKNAPELLFAEFYNSTQELFEVLKLHFECEHSLEHMKKYFRIIREYYQCIGVFEGQLEDTVAYCCRNIGSDEQKNLFYAHIFCELKINDENIYDYYKSENKDSYSFIINKLEYVLIMFASILNTIYGINQQDGSVEIKDHKNVLIRLIERLDNECKLKLKQEMDLVISKNKQYKEFLDSLSLFNN